MWYRISTNIKKILLGIGVTSVLFGCNKFDQDFKINPVNELVIEVDKTDFTAIQFETLDIPVSISYSQSSDGKYSYVWKAIGDDSVYVISREKDLHVEIKLPPKRYNLQYTVKDESNGIEFNKLLSLNVTGVFYEGWFVTHNNGEEGQLSFIRTDNVLYKNPAEELNGVKLPGKAVAAFYSDVLGRAQTASIHYFTATGVYRFDPASFLLTGKTEEVLPGQTKFEQPSYGFSLFNTDQYFVINGDVHAGMGLFAPDDIFKPFSEGFGGDYQLFSAVIASTQLSTYFYDNKHKRFLQAPYLDRELTEVMSLPNDPYDMRNVGKTMIAADKGREVYGSAVYYFVMEDTDGRYLYGMDDGNPISYKKIDIAKSPDILRATAFATSGLYQHMYYAVDNKLYLYNMVSNSAELLYSFPSNFKIRDMEMKKPSSKTLAVATWDGSEGEFHVFEINDLGTFIANKPGATIKGFGNIVQISPR